MTSVGFIGLGTMGSRMAGNIMRAGIPLVVFDVADAARQALQAQGAEIASSPAEVADRVDVLHLSLPDSPQVLEVTLGEHGIVAGAHPGLVVLDHSTVAPGLSIRLAEELRTRDIAWLDAPVSGGPGGAASGTLTIMIGGDQGAFERAGVSLAAIGKRIEYMGVAGAGAMTKLVNNFALGIHIVAMAEALALGNAAGIDARHLVEIMSKSSSCCWILENVVPRVALENRLEEEPAPWFALGLMHKDLRLALTAASGIGVPVAMGALAEQLFASASGLGWKARDHLSVFKLYSDYVGVREW